MNVQEEIEKDYQSGYIDGVYSEDAEMLNGEGIQEDEIKIEAERKCNEYINRKALVS